MPLVLPTPPDPRDPAYQRLERKINFALHVGIFAATTSGIWFFRLLLNAPWHWTLGLTLLWAGVLIGHGLWALSPRETPP